MAELNKMIEKIQNLLNKTTDNGASENEAQAAILMAQKLMMKYNISAEAIQAQNPETHKKEVDQAWVKGGQSCQWMRMLARVVSNNFRCNLGIGTGYGLVFIGLKEDVEICVRVFNFAANTMDKNMTKLRRQYRKKGLPTDGISGDYAMGFIAGLKSKFDEQVKENNWGLMLVKDQEVMEYTEKIMSKKPAKSGKALHQSGNLEVYARGYLDGKSLNNPDKCLTT